MHLHRESDYGTNCIDLDFVYCCWMSIEHRHHVPTVFQTPNIALSIQAHIHGDATLPKYGCMDYSNVTVRNVSQNAGVVVRNGIGIC